MNLIDKVIVVAIFATTMAGLAMSIFDINGFMSCYILAFILTLLICVKG